MRTKVRGARSVTGTGANTARGKAGDWKRCIDTSRSSPEDIAEPGSEAILDTLDYQLAPRSIVVLVREPGSAI